MAIPRLMPVVAVAIGGVLAIQAVTGAPKLLSAAGAFAEDAAKPKADAKTDPKADPKGSAKPAVSPDASVASHPSATASTGAPTCAPTAAELAKEAGLSPAELQVLQSLGDRRGQLDKREQDLDTQTQLIAAAEAKLDSRIQQMNSLKADITTLLSQADQQQDTETERLIRVYEAMKPKDAAGRFTLMSDAVRVPMAAKMKERALAAILAQMPAEDAKALTERLAGRVKDAQPVAAARAALNPDQAAAASAAQGQNQGQSADQAAASGQTGAASPAKPAHRARKAKLAAGAAAKPAAAANAG
jgi:flagellar motility protein MotE (MotC chaperone)